ncbi:MAG: nitronate monooxygenase [Gammaproteobacteria bacterium]
MASIQRYSTPFTDLLGIDVPIIGGAMYPCSNPELVAAVSEAGGIGIVQPLSLTYVNGYDFREGLRYIRRLTKKPVGLNLIIEQSSRRYLDRVRHWLDVALEEDIRFFVTALGKPDWVVKQASQSGAIVFHDVTSRQWAEKALDCGVDGFICVNQNAGGHAGMLSSEQLMNDLTDFGKPLICAGGIGDSVHFKQVLQAGYAGVQLGTRFIASIECSAHLDYKQAIINATAENIVLTEKISGVPVSIIETPYIKRMGTKAGWIAKRLLKGRKTKHWMRMIYSLQSIWLLKKASMQGANYRDFFQAGKSVEGIHRVKPVAEIITDFTNGSSR